MKACDNKVICSPDQPLANLTSERPEVEVFTSVYFPPTVPPLGRVWINDTCGVHCESTISQEDADLCAINAAAQCTSNPPPNPPPPVPYYPPMPPPFPPPPPPPPPPDEKFPVQFGCNTPQVCCVPCPDGTLFCYTFPGQAVCANSTAAANAIAQLIACTRAALNRVCLSGFPPNACLNASYSTTITAQTFMTGALAWAVSGGALPPGLSMAPSSNTRRLVISGTPSSPGSYDFQIRVQDALGNYMQKSYHIGVLGITNTPPSGNVNQPYSFQLTAAGGVEPYTFVVTSGSLPTGLTMTSAGLISGTPTTAGTFNAVFTVSDANP